MALRRLLGLLRTGGTASSAARALARPVDRSPPRRCIMDAMAAAGARGQKSRACAIARVRALRADGEVASRAVLACAQERARAVRAYMLYRQRQAAVATALAGRHLRLVHDRTLSSLLWVAYGQSAPKTPSPMEVLQILLRLRERVNRIENLWSNAIFWIEWIERLGLLEHAIFTTVFVAPFLALFQVTCPPECDCPFLGLQGLPFDVYPVEQGIEEVLALSARCGGLLVLTVGGLICCLFLDICSIDPWIPKDPKAVYIPDYDLSTGLKVGHSADYTSSEYTSRVCWT